MSSILKVGSLKVGSFQARPLLVVLVAGLLLLPALQASAKRGERYGLEGRFVEYDQAKNIITVKVVRTRVSGSAGQGAVAGKPAPHSIHRGHDVQFAVVPEGSVLKRTVIKNLDGAGLDTSGTKEGFLKALSLVPKDKNVIFSFEKSDEKTGPEWKLRIIQLRLTEEEAEARLQKMEEEAAAADAKEAAGAH